MPAPADTMADMVHLEPVTRRAAVDDTATVTPRRQTPQLRWNGPGGVGSHHRTSVAEPDQLDPAPTQDALQRERPNPWPVGDLRPRLPPGGARQVGVDQDTYQRLPAMTLPTRLGDRVESVLAHCHQRVGEQRPARYPWTRQLA
jgi:hypothetical protein